MAGMSRRTRNPLAAYLADAGLSAEEFADKVKCHRSQIYRAASDDRHPALPLAFRIEKATSGRVPASVWSRRSLRRRAS